MEQKNKFGGVWFNPDFAKSVTETEFINHFKNVHKNVDLKEVYKKLGGGKNKAAEDATDTKK